MKSFKKETMHNMEMRMMQTKSLRIAVELTDVVDQLFQFAGVECYTLQQTLTAASKSIG